jgi:hypothetical protein
MIKENSTFDISNLTFAEKVIRQKDIDIVFESMKETKLEFSRQQCEALYDHQQQGAIEAGTSSWQYYQQN